MMLNKIIIFSDIDDTLIQTKRKTDFSKNVVVGSYNKEGEEASFFYEGTKIFIDQLISSGITFIPTTARNFEAYKRTIFYNNQKINFAILNFGGLILIDNVEDKEWLEHISKEYETINSMETILDTLKKYLSSNKILLTIKNIDNYYISIYNKNQLDNEETITEIRVLLNKFVYKNDYLYLYENGNSFALLPNFLNKKFAVDYLINKLSPILSIGAGDNISDLDFMNSTDFKLVPKSSTLL
jgi:hydroxymethylpyrimidine pyrophosphatase-like HAD family hydrolase